MLNSVTQRKISGTKYLTTTDDHAIKSAGLAGIKINAKKISILWVDDTPILYSFVFVIQ